MRTYLCLLLVGIILSGFSQKDPKAASLLDELSQKTKSYKTIKADFTYTMDNKAAKIHESKTGTLLVERDKYRMTAAGQTVICDGKTIWTYIREANEVQINNLDLKDDAMTPSKLLTSYTDNYASKIIQDDDASSPDLEAVELIPIANKNFIKAILILDKKLKQVKSFKIFDKNGNIFTYSITLFLTDVPVTPGDFTFDETNYPGVEMIDLR